MNSLFSFPLLALGLVAAKHPLGMLILGSTILLNSAQHRESPQAEDLKAMKFLLKTIELDTMSLPYIDSTNFENAKDTTFLTKEEIEDLQLEKVYTDILTSNHYRVVARMQLRFPSGSYGFFYTTYLGEHELESKLVTYTNRGELIDHIQLAYDEIAEGISRKTSEVTDSLITCTDSDYSQKQPVVTKTTWKITPEAKFVKVQ